MLAKCHFAVQSISMESNWAAENLQTIRTLMERSALYRRALGPIATFVGAVGIAAALLGWRLDIGRVNGFAIYWLAVSILEVVGAFLLVRRQAIKEHEPVWSPPTRRVAQAMVPALLLGMVLGLAMMASFWNDLDKPDGYIFVLLWTPLYGLALHAAGFFILRGIRLFAWGFLVMAIVLCLCLLRAPLREWLFSVSPHLLMGFVFGLSHLAYGIYLYFTESRKNEA
jgi:hypothetical protein